MITGPSDTTILIDSTHTNCEIYIPLVATASDTSGIEFEFNNGQFADNNASVDASGTYELGSYFISIGARDNCNNLSTDTYTVSVIDSSATIASCNKVITSLPSNQMIDVNISNVSMTFDSGCSQNSSGLVASWSPTDSTQDMLSVGCSDVGINYYTAYAFAGNTLVDSCTNLIQVLDCCGCCP